MNSENMLVVIDALADVIHSQRKELEEQSDMTQVVLEKAELAERFAEVNKTSNERARRLVEVKQQLDEAKADKDNVLCQYDDLLFEYNHLLQYAMFLERWAFTAGVKPEEIQEKRKQYEVTCGEEWKDNEFIFQPLR